MTSMTEREARMILTSLGTAANSASAYDLEMLGAVELLERWKAQPYLEAFIHQSALDDMYRDMEQYDIRFITPDDNEWPSELNALSEVTLNTQGGVPIGLWLRGSRPSMRRDSRRVAIVGSRACTAYGESVAHSLGHDLAEEGVTVVSGLSYGIEAAAHRGSLVLTDRTLAVLPGGVASAYPRNNEPLAQRILEMGGTLVSENSPRHAPARYDFQARNRIIAALSNALVLVEASELSGSLNAVSWARLLKVPTLAVPGPVTSLLSKTPHHLIRTGAASICTDVSDILKAMDTHSTTTNSAEWRN